MRYFLADESIPGMSGGPVSDANDRLIGIITDNDRYRPDPNNATWETKALIVSLVH